MSEDFDVRKDGGKLTVYARNLSCNIYKAYIDEPIEDVGYYHNLLNTLDAATDNDTVELHLNTPGGSLETTLQIINALECTEANTVAYAHGVVASAGTFLLLTCNDAVIMPNSSIMIHPGSFYGVGGMHNNFQNQVAFLSNRMSKIFSSVYDGFLTENEIADIIRDNKEVWMDDVEVVKRLQKRKALREEGN